MAWFLGPRPSMLAFLARLNRLRRKECRRRMCRFISCPEMPLSISINRPEGCRCAAISFLTRLAAVRMQNRQMPLVGALSAAAPSARAPQFQLPTFPESFITFRVPCQFNHVDRGLCNQSDSLVAICIETDSLPRGGFGMPINGK